MYFYKMMEGFLLEQSCRGNSKAMVVYYKENISQSMESVDGKRRIPGFCSGIQYKAMADLYKKLNEAEMQVAKGVPLLDGEEVFNKISSNCHERLLV